MFVSSYNTYISTNNSQKLERERGENSKIPKNSFESKLEQSSVLESKNTQNLPINYISNYKAFSNKQKLQEEFNNKAEIKYAKSNALSNAKSAYKENTVMFSFLLEPHMTQSQTPQVDKKLPTDLQQLQEQQMRHNMVNTYLANDKYYQITA